MPHGEGAAYSFNSVRRPSRAGLPGAEPWTSPRTVLPGDFFTQQRKGKRKFWRGKVRGANPHVPSDTVQMPFDAVTAVIKSSVIENRSFESRVPHVSQHEGSNMEKSFGTPRPKPGTSPQVCVAETIATAVNRDRRTAKEIARDVGASPRTVENWRGGTLPSVPHFIALARQIPELRQHVLQWLEADQGSGEDPARLANEIAQFLIWRRGR